MVACWLSRPLSSIYVLRAVPGSIPGVSSYLLFLVEVEMGWTTAGAFDVKLDAGGKEAMRYHNIVDTCPIVSLVHRDLRVPTCPMK